MMSKVKATKTPKIRSIIQDFSEEYMKSPNNGLQYIAICAAVRFLARNAFLLKVIKIRLNTKQRQAANLTF